MNYISETYYIGTILKSAHTASRVDVSEKFSADQLWFRILSGLFQRCSIPENFWTALIQLWTALKTEIFRVKNQRWSSAVQLWNSAKFLSSVQRWFRKNQSWSALKQSWSALMFIMFSESALKNVKTMKQRCSALITSGTSTRVVNHQNWHLNWITSWVTNSHSWQARWEIAETVLTVYVPISATCTWGALKVVG